LPSTTLSRSKAVYDTNANDIVDNAEALKGNTNTPLYTVDITLDTAPVLGGELVSDGHDILMGVNGLDQSRRLGFKVNDGITTTTQYIDRTTADGIRINGAAPLYPTGDGSGLSGVALPADLADYLPLAGGTMSGNLALDDDDGASPKIQFIDGDNEDAAIQKFLTALSIATSVDHAIELSPYGGVGNVNVIGGLNVGDQVDPGDNNLRVVGNMTWLGTGTGDVSGGTNGNFTGLFGGDAILWATNSISGTNSVAFTVGTNTYHLRYE
jgi:hypothetical protein